MTEVDGTPTRNISIDLIDLSKANIRHVKKDDPEVMNLAKSIGAVGLINPLTVRPKVGDVDRFELIAGERRYLALQLAGIPTATCTVLDVDDQTAEAITVVENLQRQPVDPIKEAEAIRRLIKKYHDTDTIAAMLGQTRQWIARRAKLLDLHKDWWERVKRSDHPVSRWTFNHLELIARYDATVQKELLQELWGDDDVATFVPWECHGYDMDVKDLSVYLAGRMYELRKAPWSLDDELLVPEAGACASCPKRSNIQPDLFGDTGGKTVTKSDHCLDATCWHKKAHAVLAVRWAEEREKDSKIVPILHRVKGDVPYDRRGEDVPAAIDVEPIPSWNYREKPAKDDTVVSAMYVDGPKAGQVVKVGVKTEDYLAYAGDQPPRQTSSSSKTAGTPTPLKERRVRLNHRRTKTVINRLIDAIDSGEIKVLENLSTNEIIAMSIAFGVRNRNEWVGGGCTDREAGPKPKGRGRIALSSGGVKVAENAWEWTSTLLKDRSETRDLAERLWPEVWAIIKMRYANMYADLLDRQAVDIQLLATALHIEDEYAAAVQKADFDIPEPASWKNLTEAGTVRKTKPTGKKKGQRGRKSKTEGE